ncbi:M48 family metallopeptidase [Owenweeksia hongkongensis]|uniref:M48 family metallopeptidase n=1 Tax=Owenweeksia hongkongensis TaxID=253245 RepID=UPI003A9319C3
MKLKAALLICLGISLQAYAQDWNYYKPIQSEGIIPSDFTEAYTNKYEREREHIGADVKGKDRKRQDNFHLRSEYFVDELLMGGDVIFGDTISDYCNRILDHLLKDDPGLRHKLRIYVVKSPDVNAYATGNGIIFINLGLIAQVENEAQLAYVIAHEVIHYKNEHVLNQYIEEEKIKDGEDLYRKSNRAEQVHALSTYSKSQELEADADGFRLFFKNSGYTHRAPVYVMDVLQYSYLPFDEIPFDSTFLSTEGMKLPSSYLLKNTAPITAEADYDDSESSHPNIKTRKLEILKRLNPKDTGVAYLISKHIFDHCQRLARYEISRLYLISGRYGQAIYHTFLLEQKYGTDRYQKLTVAKALNAATVYRNNGVLYKMITEWKEVEGESQQVFHIFDEFDREDLNTLTVAYTYEAYKNYPNDIAFKKLFNKSFHELVFENDLKPNDYKSAPQDTIKHDLFSLLDSADLPSGGRRSSKISNIQRKKKEQETMELSEEDYYKTAFTPYWSDSLFMTTFEDAVDEYNNTSYRDRKGYKSRRKRKKYDVNYSLGIDSIVIISPDYAKLDERQKDGIKYLTTAEKLDEYKAELMDISDDINLNSQMLDYKNIESSDVDVFNDLSLMKNWIDERLMHENVDALVSDFDYMDPIGKKYGTNYISYTGNLSLRVRERNVAGKIIYSVFLFPVLPFTVADLLIPDYESFNYFFLFDISNGKALLAEYNYYKTNDSKDYLRSILYNHLIQVKAKAK